MIGYGLDDCSTLMSYNIPTEECDILVDFYNSMEGSGWMTSTDWLADVDACDWFGVNCVNV